MNKRMQIGDGLPIAVALLAVLMGLNLLEVLPLSLPSLDVDVRALRLPPTLSAYLAGEGACLLATLPPAVPSPLCVMPLYGQEKQDLPIIPPAPRRADVCAGGLALQHAHPGHAAGLGGHHARPRGRWAGTGRL